MLLRMFICKRRFMGAPNKGKRNFFWS